MIRSIKTWRLGGLVVREYRGESAPVLTARIAGDDVVDAAGEVEDAIKRIEDRLRRIQEEGNR